MVSLVTFLHSSRCLTRNSDCTKERHETTVAASSAVAFRLETSAAVGAVRADATVGGDGCSCSLDTAPTLFVGASAGGAAGLSLRLWFRRAAACTALRMVVLLV
eukprot:scaffold42806_cov237-Amphora_coffeaeformis.AAC.6